MIKFPKRMQHKEESVAEFIVTLKHLATHCDFGSFLNDAFCDQLVGGLSQDSIQRKLLAEDKLAFKKACEIAQAMELAERNTCDLKAAGSREVQAVSEKHKGIKKTNQPPSIGPRKSCYRCGGQHKAEVCRFHTEKCQKCGKVGHTAKKCHSREMTHQVEEP